MTTTAIDAHMVYEVSYRRTPKGKMHSQYYRTYENACKHVDTLRLIHYYDIQIKAHALLDEL